MLISSFPKVLKDASWNPPCPQLVSKVASPDIKYLQDTPSTRQFAFLFPADETVKTVETVGVGRPRSGWEALSPDAGSGVAFGRPRVAEGVWGGAS